MIFRRALAIERGITAVGGRAGDKDDCSQMGKSDLMCGVRTFSVPAELGVAAKLKSVRSASHANVASLNHLISHLLPSHAYLRFHRLAIP